MERTRTVLRTEPSLGKSDTPLPRVSTEDSRREREVRSDATQSLYVDGPGECDIMCVFLWSRRVDLATGWLIGAKTGFEGRRSRSWVC